MTILPKTPSGHARGEGSGVGSNPGDNPPNPSGFDQPVGGNSSSGPGWVPGVVASPSGSGWSPGGPPVSGQGPSSSPRWNPTSAASGSSGLSQTVGEVPGQVSVAGSGVVVNANAKKKRSAPSGPPGPSGPSTATNSGFYGANHCCNSNSAFDDDYDLDDDDVIDEDDYDGGGPTSSKGGRLCCDAPPPAGMQTAVSVASAMPVCSGLPGVSGVSSVVPHNAVNAVGAQRNSPEPGTSHQGAGGPTTDGYNSEDEYSHYGVQLSEEEWQEKDRRFERLMKRKGYVIKKMKEDGSCLFRAVADQIYGDQEMHGVVRDHCMNYIEQNSDYYSQYMTESIADYVERKRFLGVHGNHLEIQALSEMYNRPIHIYCYSAEPINIFQGGNVKSDSVNAPMRLCYHRAVHYNSIVDPCKPTIGVGLGLPNYSPGSHDRNTVSKAINQSDKDAVEKAMLEDKIKATDWEATNEAIEEQVARESYLIWLRDNEKRNTGGGGGGGTGARRPPRTTTAASTVTSGELRLGGGGEATAGGAPAATETPSGAAAAHLAAAAGTSQGSPSRSPKPSCSFRATNSPRAGCSSERDSPKPSGSSSPKNVNSSKGFQWSETASFLNGLPPGLFGLEGWNETGVLTQVLAASQQEYLDSLKKKQQEATPTNQDRNQPAEQMEEEESDSNKSDKKQKSKSSSPSKSNQ